MTTAIKSVNSVLLQTLACILSLFSSLFSVPSVLASYAPRLLLDAVSFLGTWLTGHLHLGRWCRFLKFSNSSDPFLWGRDRHSCLFLTSALICHWFFVCVVDCSISFHSLPLLCVWACKPPPVHWVQDSP